MAKSTKTEIANSLSELLMDKRLDEITVTELVERCGISRQAFYYHFSDLYGVVGYINQQLREKAAGPPEEDWRAVTERTLGLLSENRTVLLNAYRAFERSYVEHDLCRWAAPLVEARVQCAAQRYDVTQSQIGFIADILTQSMASALLSWMDRGMPNATVERMDDIDFMTKDFLDYTLRNFAERNRREAAKQAKDANPAPAEGTVPPPPPEWEIAPCNFPPICYNKPDN